MKDLEKTEQNRYKFPENNLGFIVIEVANLDIPDTTLTNVAMPKIKAGDEFIMLYNQNGYVFVFNEEVLIIAEYDKKTLKVDWAAKSGQSYILSEQK